MTLAGVSLRNLLRNRFRTAMTLAGIAVTILTFSLVRTVVTAWQSGMTHAAKDRLGTRHKVTFVMALPKKYVDQIRQVPGVQSATWANWFGGKNPNQEHEFFGAMAVDVPSFLDVYKEVSISPGEAAGWKENRRGAIVGDVLARKFGWHVGDKVTLTSNIFTGNWEFEVSGIYHALQRSVDRSSFFFHWDYLNDSPSQRQKDQIGWVVSRIDDPSRSAEISKRIDALFEEADAQTVTMSEKAMQNQFLGMLSAILRALDFVSVVILLIMMLILGNTIAMGVRERTNEYGMMRAIGFRPRHIATLVVGESIFLGIVGGALGIALAWPLIEGALGPYLEENMGAWFPFFRLEPSTILAAIVAAASLGAIAAAVPAWKAARLVVVDAIRKIG